MKSVLGRLTYANVMATIAVFVALGGAGYAATALPANSVGAKQLKKGAVTEAKIKNGAVSGSKIDLATLGTVPSAADASHASTADSATSAANATHATTATTATSADSATHATSAGHAESATEAATATEATKLGGHEASTYLGRTVQAIVSTPEATLTPETATNLTQGGSLSITVPEGITQLLGQAEISYGEPTVNDILTVTWLEEAPATCASGSGTGWKNRAFGSLSPNDRRDEGVETVLLPTTPGVHTFYLCSYTSAAVNAYLRSLTLQTVGPSS